MKRADLIRTIESFGCVLIRHGGSHDWYRNPSTGISQAVPRNREIKEALARQIIRALRTGPRMGPSGSDGGPAAPDAD